MNQFIFSITLNFKFDLYLSLKLFGRFVLRLFVAIFVFILHRKRIKILHSYANVRFCLSRVIYLIPSSFLLDRRQKQLCGCGVWWTCWGSKLISNYAGCLEILRSLLEFLLNRSYDNRLHWVSYMGFSIIHTFTWFYCIESESHWQCLSIFLTISNVKTFTIKHPEC